MRNVLLTLLLAGTAAAQPSTFFPLAIGNRWVYRDRDWNQTLTISVGLPLAAGDFVYYRVSGFAPKAMWVRAADDGSLWAIDEDSGEDRLLVAFQPGDPYDTPLSGCGQRGEAQRARVPFTAHGSMNTTAVEVRYGLGVCADTGLEREHYVENIGMVRRFVPTIAGPRVFELEHASIGPMRYTANPGTAVMLSVNETHFGRRSPDTILRLRGSLRFSTHRTEGLRLSFGTPQKFDLRLVAPNGESVWQWSETQAWPAMIEDLTVGGDVIWDFEAPLERFGLTVPDGEYRLEAWVTTIGEQRLLATSSTLKIETIPPQY